ncbi:hypothetical protein MVEN_01776600 [Mycena venus]|uniref:Transposase n=1 Tax=Mycena venus TaxID=2733690 RepID=A0A8H6XMQ2_9AGAR|nr:hypothetical protein MVEN_01776600 [Mycena venus]
MTKGKPISEDLRWAIVRMHGVGVSVKTIATYTDTSPRQIYRIINRFLTTGRVLTATQRRKTGRTRHLTSSDVAFLQGSLDHSCDKYLDELQHALQETCGRVVSQSTIWRALKRSGYRMKKMTKVAIERSAAKRAKYRYHIGLYYLPHQLVFVDESACDRRTSYRGRAWAFRGYRAVRKTFFIRGKRYSVLPAISLDGILYVNIVEGSFNAESFTAFIDGLLDKMNPFPGPNSVIVMDNCRIHKAEIIREMIEERYIF